MIQPETPRLRPSDVEDVDHEKKHLTIRSRSAES